MAIAFLRTTSEKRADRASAANEATTMMTLDKHQIEQGRPRETLSLREARNLAAKDKSNWCIVPFGYDLAVGKMILDQDVRLLSIRDDTDMLPVSRDPGSPPVSQGRAGDIPHDGGSSLTTVSRRRPVSRRIAMPPAR